MTAALQSVNYRRKSLGARMPRCLSHLYQECLLQFQVILVALPLPVHCATSRSNRLSPRWSRQAGIAEKLRRCLGSRPLRSIAVCAITIWKGDYDSFKPFAVATGYLLKSSRFDTANGRDQHVLSAAFGFEWSWTKSTNVFCDQFLH